MQASIPELKASPAARVRLRPTMASDLKYVLSLEHDPQNLPFITPWEAPQHEAAMRFPDMRHFIVENLGSGLDAVGFVILIGCRNRQQSIELKRMVVANKAQGFGRAALRVVKKVAFDELQAHRFWLDVKGRNTRAQALYDAEGFVREGVLREAVKLDVGDAAAPAAANAAVSVGLPSAGFDDLIVLSMLRAEFAQRRRLGLEALG